jgi:hypothetical protein
VKTNAAAAAIWPCHQTSWGARRRRRRGPTPTPSHPRLQREGRVAVDSLSPTTIDK